MPRKRLKQKTIQDLTQALQASRSIEPRYGIVECDRILEQIFRSLGETGTLGEILKRKSAILPHRETLWKYHKIRNKVVHGDAQASVTSSDVSKYISAIQELLRSFS